MASEYEKTRAFKRGLEGKPAKSGLSLTLPDKDEIRANQDGKRIKAERDDAEHRREKRKK